VGLRMASAWKHPKTGMWWFRKAVPRDLIVKRNDLAAMGIIIGLEVKHTLGTKDDAVAGMRWSDANAKCSRRFEAMRKALVEGLSPLTQKQIAALACDVAKQLLESDANVSDEHVDVRGFGKLLLSWRQTIDLFKLIEAHGLVRYPNVEASVVHLIQHELLKLGIIAIDIPSSRQLQARIVKDLPKVAKMLAAIQDDGDYREPDCMQGRPKVQVAFSTAASWSRSSN
jgi:hypothetical protein